MIRKTPSELAHALNRSPARLVAEWLTLLVRPLQSSLGNRLPHRIYWKLDQVARRAKEIDIHAVATTAAGSAKRALLVGHDLSLSGAPILLGEIAIILREKGWHVTLASPSPGALLDRLVEAGLDIVISPIFGSTERRTWTQFAKTVDAVICNTVATREAIESLAPIRPCLWYLHEVSMIENLLISDESLRNVFSLPKAVWAGSELSAKIVRQYRSDIRVVPYGLQPLANGFTRAPGINPDRTLKLVLLGSYEPRKGQDLLLNALRLLSADISRQCQVAMFGRVLDPDFFAQVRNSAKSSPNISINDELDTDQYKETILDCDAVIVSSRDDTLPLVSLDALGAGRVLMCTSTTGTSAYLKSGVNGFVSAEASPEAIASMLTTAINQRANWPTIGARGATVFETCFSKGSFEAVLAEQLDTMIRPERV